MSPEFAKAVDPVFLFVLEQIDSISAGTRVDPAQLHSSVIGQIQRCEDQMSAAGQSQSWPLARYALCAWIDDLMITRAWEGQKWWENHKLEFQFFQSNEAGTEFFKQAKKAEQSMNRDALEVFYIAVVLGFRGLYAMGEASFLAQQYALPTSVEEWTARVAGQLQVRPNRPALQSAGTPISGAPPLESRFHLVAAAVLAMMLLTLAAVLSYHILLA